MHCEQDFTDYILYLCLFCQTMLKILSLRNVIICRFLTQSSLLAFHERERGVIMVTHLLHFCAVRVLSHSVVSDSPTLWTAARQAPLSMRFSRQEYWSVLPYPPPGDLLDPGIKLASLVSPAWAGGFFTTSANWEAYYCCYLNIIH